MADAIFISYQRDDSEGEAKTASTTAVNTVAVPAAKAPGSEFVGEWKRSGNLANDDSLGRLVISGAGSAIMVRA